MNVFIKNLSLYFSPTFLRGITGLFVQIPLVTYYLGPEELGVFALITGLLFILLPLSDSGIDINFQTNYYKRKDKEIFVFNILFYRFTLTIFWITFFFLIYHFFSDYFLQDNKYFLYFLFILGSYFFTFSNITFIQVFVLNKNPKKIAFIDTLKIISNLLLMFLLFEFYNLKILALLISLLITNFLINIIELIFLKKYFKFRVKKKLYFYNLKFGLKTISMQLFGMSSFYLERIIVNFFYGIYQLGIYYHARTYYQFMAQGIKSITLVYNPNYLKLAEISGNKKFKYLLSLNKHLLSIVLIFGIAFVLISEHLISYLTHDKFTEAHSIVNIGFFTVINSVFFSFISSRLIVRKKINNIIFTSNIAQIFFILLILVISYFFEYRNILIIISIFVLSNLISSLINYNFLSGEKKLFNELFKIFILVNFLFLLTLIFESLLNLNFMSKIIIILSIFTLLFFYYYSIRKEVFKILNEASN